MYAEINKENVVVSLFTPPEGFTIKDCFHPSLMLYFIDIGENEDGVQVGWVYDGETFAAPVEEVAEEPAAEEPVAEEPVAEEPVA